MGLFSIFTPSPVAINATTQYSWEYCVSLWFEWKILTEYPFKWPLVRPTTFYTDGCYYLIRPRQDSLFPNAILRAGFLDRKVRYFRCVPLPCQSTSSFHSSLIFMYPRKELNCQGGTTVQYGHSTPVTYDHSSFTNINSRTSARS